VPGCLRELIGNQVQQARHVSSLQVTQQVCDMFSNDVSPRSSKVPDSEVHPALEKFYNLASICFVPAFLNKGVNFFIYIALDDNLQPLNITGSLKREC
jgi:hypothetical protein